MIFPLSVFGSESLNPNTASPEIVKIGVLAKRGVEKCLEKWGPSADYLTENIPGYSFEIKPLEYDEINAAVEKEEVDFILANSSFYVELENHFEASRILTLNNLSMGKRYTKYGGVLFCRADSKNLRDLEDLKGKTLMAVKETSFGGWQTVWRELKECGIDPHEDFASLSYGKTHDAVVYAVRDSKVDAGTVRTNTLERMDAEGKINLEDFYVFHKHGNNNEHYPLLHSTRMYPEWPFAKVKHTSDELAKKVAVALLEMSSDSPAAKAARCAGWTIPLSYQPVHDCLKKLRIGPYKDYGKVTLNNIFQQYWVWLLVIFIFGVIILLTVVWAVRLNQKLENEIKEREKDITERRKVEEALRENEEKFRTLYESSSDAVMLLNEKGFFDCNNSTLKIFGYTNKDEFCCKHPSELSPLKQPCGTDSMILANENIEKAMECGNHSFEWMHQKLDGTQFPCEVLLNAMVLDEKKVLQAVVRDITERKKAEKFLSDTVKRYTAMINTVPARMFIKDIENKYIEVNEAFCKFVGKSKDKIIGKNIHDVYSKELAEKFYANDKSVIENDKEIINQEEQYIDDDGNVRWMSSSKIPLHDDDGKVSSLVGITQDTTEQHQIQDQLTQSDKLAAIGQLAAGVAHEINNPVGYINSNLNTMSKYLKKINEFIEEKDESTPEDLDDFKEILEDFADAVDESMEGTDRVKKIVADLKSFSRVDRAEKELTDINEGISTTLNVVWNEIKYKAEVKKEFGDIPKLFCMPNQLNQVFMNLMVNAAHAIEKEMGLITIKTWADDNNINISVTDDGAGIPEENIKKLFNPFFTTKEVGKGTGLGLSLSYDIVKKHNGHIDVKSEVGVGTVFTVTFPLEGIDERKTETVNC